MTRLSLALLALAGCSGDSCPTDDCTVKARTVVKWVFDKYPDWNFPNDSCVDFGARKVSVDLVDANGVVTTLADDCGIAQVVYEALPPGDYTAYVMPLDADGAGLLSAPTTAPVSVTADGADVTVNVPWTSWLGTYTGTFLFRLSWGGVSCDQATPVAIKNQTLTLTVGGVVQDIMTDDGQMLNGSDKKPCKKLTDQFPQSALGAKFGPATLLVEGFDDTNTMMFSKQFDTFVGAGITNPTLTFDVPMQ